jgi:type III secretion protein V
MNASTTPLPSLPLRNGSKLSGLMLVLGVLVVMATMVATLTPWLIDTLLAVNVVIGALLLLMAMYVTTPLEFSAFPSVMLITTVFRLAVSIATTKLILLDGAAGHIIDAFGRFVAGGNLIVGLVVFLIVTVVQFIVIAKGAERVAEVSARFTLDAMPGKQLSIDSDLRSGLIDKDEARRRRRELEQESKMHGSLDGAMKFVKGEAICGIVIILINLLGGLGVGVLQNGMTLSAAMVKYSILTIGDGMVAQLPALLSASAAAILVTRSGGDAGDNNLAEVIGRQFAAKPQVLLSAAGLCLVMAAVPGFPAPVFVLLGVAIGSVGALLLPPVQARVRHFMRPARETVLRRKDAPPVNLATALPAVRPALPLVLQLPGAAMNGMQPERIVHALEGVLDRINLDLGVPLPRIALVPTTGAPEYVLLAHEVPIARGAVPVGNPGDLPAALAEMVTQSLRRHLGLFFGTQDANSYLVRASHELPDVVKEVLRALPLQRVADILRRLIEEEAPIRNARDILEALADAAQREKDVHALTEFARIAQKRQLSHRVAPDGHLRALLLAPALEEVLRQAIRVVGGQQVLSLDPPQTQLLTRALADAVRSQQPNALVTAVDVRRHVRLLIQGECFDTPVLSYHELAPDLRLEPLGRVEVPDGHFLEAR